MAERELASLLSAMFRVECRKGSSPYLSGFEAADVLGLPGIHIEAKRRAVLSLPAAVRQSQQDACPGDVPIVCHRPNRCGWMVSLSLDDLPRLAAAVASLTDRHRTA
jgi:hypothetical protein